ncbi:aspartate aminotransferase family protein [Jiangella muralis]|uniref:aspartate aminotransferase family protein n=1 Tax=Jiangella muralis TaxID=702383 RepID=UPI00069DDD1D|nr:aspartate aminotransferase family protein [Jiangella muralis]
MTADARSRPRSRELHRRASRRTPGGVHSNIRLAGPRIFFESGSGPWLRSVDGDEYVDYLLGQGPNFLGHAPEPVVRAVSEASRTGVIFGGQHELEIEAAELVCETLGWPDMVRFGVSGTEAVQAAFRLARAATGRTKIVRFEGHYHGWLDNVLTAPDGDGWGPASAGQLASHLDDFVVLPWNDADRLAALLAAEGDLIAAVIMEPVMINAGVIEPRPGYLERVRELCTAYGIVLIFDEVLSGFRLGLDGAAGRYGVTPDLATYAKALAAGWPVAALAGRADLMEHFGTGEVNHSGTFNGSVVATAAVKASLELLRDEPPYAAIDQHGTALMAGIRELGQTYGIPLRAAGLPAAFHVSFGDADVVDYRTLQELDLARYEELAEELVGHGVWVAPRGVWYVSAAHGPGELDAALTRFAKTLTEWL